MTARCWVLGHLVGESCFVGYDQLSSNLIRALIATEDERFAEHSGIDARAFVRALVKRGVMMQKNAGGVVP